MVKLNVFVFVRTAVALLLPRPQLPLRLAWSLFRTVSECAWQEQAKLLMTIPDVHYYAAMGKILLSETDDAKRFASPEKLASWVGLAPQVHISGKNHWTRHITRKGSRRAQWILTQCAQFARQHDPKMRAFYERIEQKHASSKAVVAVARKMLAIMHVMLTRNEPYHGEDQQLTEQKHKRLERIPNTA